MAKEPGDEMSEGPALRITRLFNAPRALVFAAFVEPAQFLKGMGPRDHPVGHVELRRTPVWLEQLLRPTR